jgi:hypothetical protein
LAFYGGRNLAHLPYQAQSPDRNEYQLQVAAELTEQLIKKCFKGLITLPQETQRWLRSAKQAEADQRPLARLQNPKSQATYASYIVRIACFYLRIVAYKESRVDDLLSQRCQVVDSSDEASGEDAGTGREYNDSEKGNNAGSSDNDDITPLRRLRKPVQIDKIKDAQELFT